MLFIDPHVHMTSRTTDDYDAMRKAGIVAVIEPAFWLGQARTEAGSFKDYFQQSGRLGTLPCKPVWYQALLHHRA
jgi:predicted metal-dependent TIM-barrel fold hydrolase